MIVGNVSMSNMATVIHYEKLHNLEYITVTPCPNGLFPSL